MALALMAHGQIPGLYFGPYATVLRIQNDPFPTDDSSGGPNRLAAYFRNDFGIREYSGMGMQFTRSGKTTRFVLHGYLESPVIWNGLLLIRQPVLPDLSLSGGVSVSRRAPIRSDLPGIRLGMNYAGISGWSATQELIWTPVREHNAEDVHPTTLRLLLSREMPDRTRISGELLIHNGKLQLTSMVSIHKKPWICNLSSGIAPASLSFVLTREGKNLAVSTGISHHQKLGASPLAAFEIWR